MAAKRPTLGVDHPTVVPANFEPERRGASEANGTEDESVASTDEERSGDADDGD